MATLTPLTVGNAAAPTGWASAPNGALGDDSDATFGYDDTNSTTTVDQGWELGETDADLGNMDTLSGVLRYARSANSANKTWTILAVRVMSGVTVLAAADSGGTFATVASSITTTTPTNSSAYVFSTSGYLNTTANKTLWDAAVVETRIGIDRNKGGNSDAFRVFEIDFTGTYTASAPSFTGSLSETEATDSVAASGSYVPPDKTGTLTETEANDTPTISGVYTPPAKTGSLSETEANDSLSASGAYVPPSKTGTLGVTEAADVAVGIGSFTTGGGNAPAVSKRTSKMKWKIRMPLKVGRRL